MKLTVIIRNDGPMIFCGDSPSYRSVQIEFTSEQLALLKLQKVGVDCGRDVFEDYSKCFLEDGKCNYEGANGYDGDGNPVRYGYR